MAAAPQDYCAVRTMTERLAAPLTPEDQTVQSMADVSPTKWHRAHTTWFFETFVLGPHRTGYRPCDERYGYLFNSYYEGAGERHPRPERGLLSRPGAAEVGRYRDHVDQAMMALLATDPGPEVAALVELGLHHEQQHQELLMMDAHHVLSCNPLLPAYGPLPWPPAGAGPVGGTGVVQHEGGVVAVGHDSAGFAFDNEGPRHEVLLRPFGVSARLVTNGDWLAFMADSGYGRADLWMSEGWATVQAGGWRAPLYWRTADGRPWDAATLGGGAGPATVAVAGRADGGPWVFNLDGLVALDPAAPVDHVSWFEADAYARWAGGRLPLEAEWEAVAPAPNDRPGADSKANARPDTATEPEGWYGAVWQWTASPYTPYPRFVPPAGAVGEYNGKFMVNQQVLRGSSWATPPGHARRTYRNFFPTAARWCVGGLRLAWDA